VNSAVPVGWPAFGDRPPGSGKSVGQKIPEAAYQILEYIIVHASGAGFPHPNLINSEEYQIYRFSERSGTFYFYGIENYQSVFCRL